ncbi:HoxE-like protein [Candidatus Syntrophocurvum alkaliphilum]|uniref:HoxE-like protein n=1 Tax=Candidatus Syntrophocurvum alkaliphilum TaxID=2293317 RepID=A0A6I6DBY0_9FIRM|nr:HoxE-like protein [Candidatus Syntrophocurvum alkaliphilum]
MTKYANLINDLKEKKGGIIEAFHAIEKEYSYLPEDAIVEAAKTFNVSTAEAYGVATFYSMFSVKPRGKNVIRLCESAPCHIAGADEVFDALKRELGIDVGESTEDGLFALELTECVGQCQATPVITINGKAYLDVNPAKIPEILAEYK